MSDRSRMSATIGEPTPFWRVFRAWMSWALVIGVGVGLVAGAAILVGSQIGDDRAPFLPSLAVTMIGGTFMGLLLALAPGFVQASAAAWLATNRTDLDRETHIRQTRTTGVAAVALTGGTAVWLLAGAGRLVSVEVVLASFALTAAGAAIVATAPRIVDRYWEDL